MATTGTAPHRSKESSVPLVINKSAGLRLSMLFAPKALHLLFLLMLDCNLDLDPRTPRWPPTTPDPNNDGQLWLMEADCRGRTCPPAGPDLPPAPVPREDAPDRAPAADDDGTDESGSWSDTSLDLGGQALAQAIETLLGMYRNQLQRTALLSNRELGGKVGGLRRHLHSKQWSYVSQHARRILDGEDLASWQTFEHRATHEYRPHRRPADDDC
eukprot:s3853_g2.t1